MGLFGGFRAKFSKDSAAKSSSKNTKKNEVVCIGYRVFSEFDSPPQYLPVHRQPSTIRTVAPRPQSAPNSENTVHPTTSTAIQTQIVTNPKVKKLSKKRTAEPEKHVSTISLTPINNNTYEEVLNSEYEELSASTPTIAVVHSESITLRNGGIKEESRSAPNSVYVQGKTSSFNPSSQNEISTSNYKDTSTEVTTTQEVNTRAPKSILKYKPPVSTHEVRSQNFNSPNNNIIITSDEYIYSDTEYDKTMTLASSNTSKSNGHTTETVDYMSATEAVTKSSSTNVATYVHTEVGSSSYGSTSNNNNENNEYNTVSYYTGGYSYSQNTHSIGNTSNYAASIFFGGEEEPEVQRPRRTNLAVVKNEEDRRSSAEC